MLKKGEVIRYASPGELMEEVKDKVGEREGSFDELNELKLKFNKGQIMRRASGFVLRVADKNLTDDFVRVEDITLEDVYLYYSERFIC